MNDPRILALVAIGGLSVSTGAVADDVYAEIAESAVELGWVDEQGYMWCSEIRSTHPPGEYYRISNPQSDWSDPQWAMCFNDEGENRCADLADTLKGRLVWAAFNLCRGETLEWVNENSSPTFRFYVDDQNTIGVIRRTDDDGPTVEFLDTNEAAILEWVDEQGYIWCSEINPTRDPAEYYRISGHQKDWSDPKWSDCPDECRDSLEQIGYMLTGLSFWVAFNICNGETLEWVNEYSSPQFRFYLDDHNTIKGLILRTDDDEIE